MAIKTTAGTVFRISAGVPATFNQAGYAALTYTTVGEITDLAEFGRAYEVVKHNPIDNRGTVKVKGSFDEGSIAMQLGLDTDDAGQILMKAAVTSDNNYACKITDQKGDIYYFQAQVITFKVGLGGVNQVTKASATLEITTSSTGVGVVEVLI